MKLITPFTRQFVASAAVLLLLLFSAKALMAQRSAKFMLGSGTAYYNGDLTEGFTNNQYRPSLSVGVSYYLNPFLSIKGEVNQAWIGAADSLASDPIRAQRNLHFRSAVTDFSVQLVLEFLEDRSIGKAIGGSSHFTPYLFGGIGGFAFRPLGVFQGESYDLQSLGTEGQFLVGSQNRPYSRFQINIPFGLGIEYRAGKNWGLQLEASYRYTFTDYLDDVSTVFADQDDLRDFNPLAAYFANPSGNQDLFPEGSQRGNANIRDSYILLSVKAVYFFERVSRFSRCYTR